MIDFNKITAAELTTLKQIVSRASEKSEWEKIYLFTTDSKEKAKLFCFSHRFLINLYNLLDDGSLRVAIQESIEETKNSNTKVHLLCNELNKNINYGSTELNKQLDILVNSREVNDMIDLFSILTEKAHTLQISKLKAILLEGRSGEEYTKIQKKLEDKKTSEGYKSV